MNVVLKLERSSNRQTAVPHSRLNLRRLRSTKAKPSGSPSETATTAGGTLFAHEDFMSRCDLVLASQSPRRLEIVGMMGLAVRHIHSMFVLVRPLCCQPQVLFAADVECVGRTAAASRLGNRRTRTSVKMRAN